MSVVSRLRSPRASGAVLAVAALVLLVGSGVLARYGLRPIEFLRGMSEVTSYTVESNTLKLLNLIVAVSDPNHERGDCSLHKVDSSIKI